MVSFSNLFTLSNCQGQSFIVNPDGSQSGQLWPPGDKWKYISAFLLVTMTAGLLLTVVQRREKLNIL